MGSATSVRREAVQRLVDLCDATWDADVILARGAVPVLIRKALRAADGDELALAELRDLWPIASGRPEPLIDAALAGLPDPDAYRPAVPTWDVHDLEEALA